MTILNERRKKRSPRALKWIVVLAILIGVVFMLYRWGGEQQLERVEVPVTLDQPAAE